MIVRTMDYMTFLPTLLTHGAKQLQLKLTTRTLVLYQSLCEHGRVLARFGRRATFFARRPCIFVAVGIEATTAREAGL